MGLWSSPNATAQAEVRNRPLNAIHQSPGGRGPGLAVPDNHPTSLDPDGFHGLSSPRGGYLIVSCMMNPYILLISSPEAVTRGQSYGLSMNVLSEMPASGRFGPARTLVSRSVPLLLALWVTLLHAAYPEQPPRVEPALLQSVAQPVVRL